MKLSKLNAKRLIKTINENETLTLKLLIECWNSQTPHFGGIAPHRYDDANKLCSYCNRPKNWIAVNAGYYASEIVYGNLVVS